MTTVNIQTVFFASLREVVGIDHLALEFQGSVRLVDVFQALEQRLTPATYDALHAQSVRIAINQTLIDRDAEAQRVLQTNDEIAFLPPVTGG